MKNMKCTEKLKKDCVRLVPNFGTTVNRCAKISWGQTFMGFYRQFQRQLM